MSENGEGALYRLIGGRIRERRVALQLTQAELATKVGVGRTSITNIENGRQPGPLHQFARIAHALDLDAAALLPSREELQAHSAIDVVFDGAEADAPPMAANLIAQVLSTDQERK